MHAYFSHSYRDVAVNSYFLDQFLTEEVPLRADQKTDVWCVVKLERYLWETTGFVSIIPRRASDGDPGAYSPYIAQELSLARRARVPRLIFLDDQVYRRHRLDFPEDVHRFRPDALEEDRAAHALAIRAFRRSLDTTYRVPLPARPKQVTLVLSEERDPRSIGEDVAEILRREGFVPMVLSGRRADRGLGDVRLLETLWAAELCVFSLGARLSDAHIALAMAHAHCIPSLRLRFDRAVQGCAPDVAGVLRWSSATDLLETVAAQLASYKQGLVRPIEHAQTSGATAAAQQVGTMRWRPRPENRWAIDDGPALLGHVHPDHAFVRDEVSRLRAALGRAAGLVGGREESRELCRVLYDGIRRHRFGYEIEQRSDEAGTQDIRTPSQIAAHNTATCIDAACLFASLLEAAGQQPVILVLGGGASSHAVAGYRPRGEPALERPGLADLRAAVRRGDLVLFEATGAIEAGEAVGAEAPGDRVDKLLGFDDATRAAARMLMGDDASLIHFADICVLRAGPAAHRP